DGVAGQGVVHEDDGPLSRVGRQRGRIPHGDRAVAVEDERHPGGRAGRQVGEGSAGQVDGDRDRGRLGGEAVDGGENGLGISVSRGVEGDGGRGGEGRLEGRGRQWGDPHGGSRG